MIVYFGMVIWITISASFITFLIVSENRRSTDIFESVINKVPVIVLVGIIVTAIVYKYLEMIEQNGIDMTRSLETLFAITIPVLAIVTVVYLTKKCL